MKSKLCGQNARYRDSNMELTTEQRDALLKLGDTESEAEVISIDVLQQLLKLGLVYKRESDGHLDLTDLGESVYDELSAE